MHNRGALVIGTADLALFVGLVVWYNPFSKKDEPGTPPVEETFFPPPLTASRFLNTGPDAQYIGTEACAKCHQREHHSYQLTAHSRALSDLDPKAEPPDGSFFHRPSGRHFRVYRQGDLFRHEEVARAEDGSEIARLDVPIRYLIGSGNFCRSYLAEIDGFLHESPVTWYTSKKTWDMSPGYDFPKHHSFERPVTVGCLSCHAGRRVIDPRPMQDHRVISMNIDPVSETIITPYSSVSSCEIPRLIPRHWPIPPRTPLRNGYGPSCLPRR